MKKVLSVILVISALTAALFSVNVSANGGTTKVGYLTFTEYGTYCAATKCDTSASGVIKIPSTVKFNGKSLSVTKIGDSAFENCVSVSGVTIPNGVTAIGKQAFWNCLALTSVNIPGSVTVIDNDAFYYCTSLKNVTIPGGVKKISDGTFAYCQSLTTVTVPNGVTSIYDNAFFYCSGLTSIIIPASVTEIGWYAFHGCSNLKTVYYKGSAEKWNSISIGNNNNYVLYAEKVNNYVETLKGDINSDGKENNKDVVALFRAITNAGAGYDKKYDFNNDGKLNNKDVVALFRYISAK